MITTLSFFPPLTSSTVPPPPSSSPTAIDLLRRWISGDLRRTDERSLETAAREDELVGDALRGYRSRPEDDHAAALGRLRAGLPARKRGGPAPAATVGGRRRSAAPAHGRNPLFHYRPVT